MINVKGKMAIYLYVSRLLMEKHVIYAMKEDILMKKEFALLVNFALNLRMDIVNNVLTGIIYLKIDFVLLLIIVILQIMILEFVPLVKMVFI